jgi:hypothetical protein
MAVRAAASIVCDVISQLHTANGTQPATSGFDAPRHFLFVSAREPIGAAAAVWGWAYGLPDLCVTSPSREAHSTASFACAGRLVSIVDEPLLARRAARETAEDFAARFAEALRVVYAFDTRAALVVCDELPPQLEAPFSLDDGGLLRHTDRLEREVPLP